MDTQVPQLSTKLFAIDTCWEQGDQVLQWSVTGHVNHNAGMPRSSNQNKKDFPAVDVHTFSFVSVFCCLTDFLSLQFVLIFSFCCIKRENE